MNKYAMKDVLRDTLVEALKESEADLLIGVISEQGTVVVCPYWEVSADQPTEKDLVGKTARFTASVADEISEGICIGLYVYRAD